jgi:hypothetical protein
MYDYYTCPDCGANLGHGERCGCTLSRMREETKRAIMGLTDAQAEYVLQRMQYTNENPGQE